MIFKSNALQNISFSVYSAWRNYADYKGARVLSRMIRKGDTKSVKRSHIPKATTMNSYARNTLYSSGPKRATVLSKIFMEHICDLIGNGNYGQEFSDLGIEVVEAKVSPNYRVLFVYWIHTKAIDEESVNELLKETAKYLRFELSTLKVMGEIPEVRFIKHEQFIHMATIEKILNDLSYARESEKHSEQQEKEEVKKALQGEEEEMKDMNIVKISDFDDIEMVLGYMEQNVYGLDRTKIIENINYAKTKHCQLRPVEMEGTLKMSENEIRFDKKVLSKTIFREVFDLKKQRKLRKKLLGTIDSMKNEEESYDYYEDYDDSYQDEEDNVSLSEKTDQ